MMQVNTSAMYVGAPDFLYIMVCGD